MQEDKDRFLIHRDGSNADVFAVAAAIILTFLVHAAVYWAMPAEFQKLPPKEKLEELKLEILPPKISKRVPDFIEANPYANQEKPASPDAPESFQDQRAADEIPDPSSKSKLPFVAGELKDGKKIISGTSSENDALSPQSVMEVLERPLVQQAKASETAMETPRQAAAALSETEPSQAKAEESETKKAENAAAPKGEDKESAEGADKKMLSAASSDESTMTAKNSDATDSKNLKGKSDETRDEKIAKNNADSGAAKIAVQNAEPAVQKAPAAPRPEAQESPAPKENPELPKPQSRPTLSMRIPAGLLVDSNRRASMRGTVAVDSRFSEFGAYQQRMIEAISRQWNLIASSYDLTSAIGSSVVVEFHLNTHGDLTHISTLYSSSTKTASALCEQSILTTAPYGDWTQEMINSLGTQDQTVRITFHYR